MTGAGGSCHTPHVGRAQVGGICKQLQRLGISECLKSTGGLPVKSDSRRIAFAVACWNGTRQGNGMTRLWKGFSRYTAIGIANTVIHWQLFFVFRVVFELNQAASNFFAFCAAASFSFYLNAIYTFAMPVSLPRYALFMLCMGGVSLAVGWLADRWRLPGLVTVVAFSLVSLVCGFLLSKWVVFRERGQ